MSRVDQARDAESYRHLHALDAEHQHDELALQEQQYAAGRLEDEERREAERQRLIRDQWSRWCTEHPDATDRERDETAVDFGLTDEQ